MGTSHQSFFSSRHGAFVSSRHGWRGREREGANVWKLDSAGHLLWTYDTQVSQMTRVSVDPNNRIVCCGTGGGLWVLSPNGVEEWSKTSVADCVAVDSSGNVYAGITNTIMGNRQILIRKYGPDGGLQWTKDVSGVGLGSLSDLATNGTYVYGCTRAGLPAGANLMRINCIDGGNLVTAASPAWWPVSSTSLSSIEILGSGIVCTGTQLGFPSNFILVFACSSELSVLWDYAPGRFSAFGLDCAVVGGNVLVCGSLSGGKDLWLIDPSGPSLVWSTRCMSGLSGCDSAYTVCGRSAAGTVMRYNSSGERVWSALDDGVLKVRVATDSAGSVVVVGDRDPS